MKTIKCRKSPDNLRRPWRRYFKLKMRWNEPVYELMSRKGAAHVERRQNGRDEVRACRGGSEQSEQQCQSGRESSGKGPSIDDPIKH